VITFKEWLEEGYLSYRNKSMINFYDKRGKPVLFSPDDQTIYKWNGMPYGFLVGNLVYNFAGEMIARFDHGWLRDKMGNAVCFTDDADPDSGPSLPSKDNPPVKGIPHVLPVRKVQVVPPPPVPSTMRWSGTEFQDLK